MTADEIAAALRIWRESVVNLSGANRLIKFRPSKTGSVFIERPSPEEILSGLRSRKRWTFCGRKEGDDDSPSASEEDFEGSDKRGSKRSVLYVPRAEKELGPVLRGLMRRANAEFNDRGLSVLYLAFGMLHWKDVDNFEMASPLLLVPVVLESRGPNTTPALILGDDDTVMNPSLVLRMRDFGIEIPALDDIPDITVEDMLSEVLKAIKPRRDWTVDSTVVLSTFSFHKEAMYRDLLDNEQTILEHPIVRALGTSDPAAQSDNFIFDPIDPADIDHAAPPEDVPLVLDADSSQRAAVSAALAGKSFVLDGPPGTGKSQTIANMIGVLLHAGRTVLFVSEKAAALEVVRNRLADAGLENYLLELHSHKASRKAVASALAYSLDNVTQPPQGLADLKRSSLRERRQQLNDYAAAMNELREPLGLSLHEVLGLLSQLNDVPSAPVPETTPEDLDPGALESIRGAALELKRSWRPALQGQSFLWREVTREESIDLSLYKAQLALEELEGHISPNNALCQALSIDRLSDISILIKLLKLQHEERPEHVPEWWLTTVDLKSIADARDRLTELLEAISEADCAVLKSAEVEWHKLPDPGRLPSVGRIAVDVEPIDCEPLSASACRETAEKFERIHERITRAFTAAREVASELGLEEPKTFREIDRTLRLADLGYREHRPLRGWLTADGLQAARQSVEVLRSSLASLAEAESAASSLFSAEILKAPVAEVCERFEVQHRGWRKLSGQYRADKKTVVSWLVEGISLKDGVQKLALAANWAEASGKHESLVEQHAATLGGYWRGRDTDFDALDAALDVASEALELIDDQALPRKLATHLTSAEPNPAFPAVIDDVHLVVKEWTSALAPAPALAGRPELALKPVQVSLDWLGAHIAPLRDAAARISAITDVTGNQALSLAQANQILNLRDEAQRRHEGLRHAEEEFKSKLDFLYRGTDTDLSQLTSAIAWAEEVRNVVGGALTEEQVVALKDSYRPINLEAALEKWESARGRILDAFDESRHSELERELDDFKSAAGLLEEFREDSIGQQEWFSYKNAREHLEKHGLSASIDFCIEQKVPANQVPQIIERALLRSWADNVIHRDGRLHPLLARDRSALVDEFRSLDKLHIESAACDIIRAANSRRPSVTAIGEPAVIRREGMKKARHLPVRELIARTRNTSLSIKPCFMMSPLAVSQYLPPDMNFDVVIFDEASQVRPGDAINCIYRGRQLILAGDDKQLPPTSFFERVDSDEALDDELGSDVADFQSVLELAKASGAFVNLRLNWHYRSKHEGLIEFSNYRFYDGGLITYPSARTEGPDVGVEFIRVDGVYRRGGGADNPIEAAKVAERVIDHFRTRPHLTLGVVTFSVAQANAIQAAIDQARAEHRDLERHFDEGNRLTSFFVKSLESVQGDERDVIIFSVGYGPDEAGKLTTNFGVLNKPKGWRRLNVAITRARQRIEIVSSLSAGQIPSSQNENVEHLRAYLDFAERGPVTLALNTGSTGLGPESPFEESVLKTIRDWGYNVEPQVGSGGYRIDIGVRHPARPGMFALGVECDGYQYHSAPAARDRDRLRDQVLRGLGWRLHRIWGTAWYRNRSEEEKRLRAAIEDAINERPEFRGYDSDAFKRPTITTTPAEFDALPRWTSDYGVAAVPMLPRWVDPSADGSGVHMVEAIKQITTVEGPVHIDIVYQRLREAWGLGRIGHRIAGNIDEAIRLSRPEVARSGEFLDIRDRDIDRVRTAGRQLRTVEQVHLGELQLAITLLLRDSGVTREDDLIRSVSRIFGWTKAGAEIRRRIATAVRKLIKADVVVKLDSGDLELAR